MGLFDRDGKKLPWKERYYVNFDKGLQWCEAEMQCDYLDYYEFKIVEKNVIVVY